MNTLDLLTEMPWIVTVPAILLSLVSISYAAVFKLSVIKFFFVYMTAADAVHNHMCSVLGSNAITKVMYYVTSYFSKRAALLIQRNNRLAHSRMATSGTKSDVIFLLSDPDFL